MLSSSRLRSAPSLLFQNGEQGVWFDPSDFSTLFQDSTGSTPVTALGQPVGKMLDKSKGLQIGPELAVNGDFGSGSTGWTVTGTDGTHVATFSGGTCRYQSDTTSPVLLVTQSAAPLTVGRTYELTVTCSTWVSGAVRFPEVNAAAAGTQLVVNGAGTFTSRFTATTTALGFTRHVANVDLTIDSIAVKEIAGNHASQPTAADRPKIEARINQLLATATASTQSVTVLATPQTLSFKGTGTVTLSGVSTAGPLVGTGAGNRVSLTFTPTAGSLTLTVSGTVTEWQLQEGSAFTVYQDVVTATNYTDIGAPRSLKANGTNTWMSTANIDFTGTDAVTVFAGVRKNSDAAVGVLAELSTNSDSTNGTFDLGASVGGNNYYAQSRGTVRSTRNATGYVAPNSAVLVAEAKISTDTLRLHGNNAAPLSSATDQGSGNYGNYAMYFWRRAGTSLPFNGNKYAFFAPGRASTAAEIAQNKRWINHKMGGVY